MRGAWIRHSDGKPYGLCDRAFCQNYQQISETEQKNFLNLLFFSQNRMVIRYNMKERQGITFIQKKGEFTNEFNFISDSIDSTDCDRATHRTAVRRIRESTTGY